MGADTVKLVPWDWKARDHDLLRWTPKAILERLAGGPIQGRVSLEFDADTGIGSALVILKGGKGGRTEDRADRRGIEPGGETGAVGGASDHRAAPGAGSGPAGGLGHADRQSPAGGLPDALPALAAGEGEAGEAGGPAEDGGGQPAEEPKPVTACRFCGFPEGQGTHGQPGEVGQDGLIVRCTVYVGGHRPWRVVRGEAK